MLTSIQGKNLTQSAAAFPTFVIVQLVPVPVNNIRLQEVEERARDQEAVGEGEAFDVAHVQGEGVGGRGDSAQAHQLADHIPYTDTWRSNIICINICINSADY